MTTEYPLISDYRKLFLDDIPLLDVRAPTEFEKGSFPLAHNAPLIDDRERHEIGIRYHEQGQDSAVELGIKLVSGEKKQRRIDDWQRFLDKHPQGAIYCFRGGMRSRIAQQWIQESSGLLYPRIAGGYKALRQFLLDELDLSASTLRPRVIGGRTGVGKTLLLQRLPGAVDLEALAWHRGSAFGRHATAQPTQIDFENRLAIALLKHRTGGGTLIMEDEGRAIGSLNLPAKLHAMLQRGELYILEAPLEERIANSLREYVQDTLAEYTQLWREQEGFDRWANYLQDSLDRIQRRLGGERHSRARNLLSRALLEHQKSGRLTGHEQWIHLLLTQYYDPMYDYQLKKKKERISFTGTASEISAAIYS